MKFTAWVIRAEGWYIGITWNRENACCWLRQGLAMALPPGDLNAVQTLLPGIWARAGEFQPTAYS